MEFLQIVDNYMA